MNRLRTGVVTVAVALSLVAGGCGLVGDGGYAIAADFERAVGLYPGSPVRLEGVDIGEITDVRNHGGVVRVEMRITRADPQLPRDARAVIIPTSLLGERYVQLGPIADGGPRLEPGDVIPVQRTTVPAEIDELTSSLEQFLQELDPASVAGFVHNLSEVLDGQGRRLNSLLDNAAATMQLLADERDEVTRLTSSLADLSSALVTRTDTVSRLIADYDAVAGAVARNREELEGAVVQLSRASNELGDLLLRHHDPLIDDVEVLTTAGRTLQRNLDRLDVVMRSTVRLFEAAGRAYDAEHNWLPLNNQAPPGQTSDPVTTAVRDRLAGVCRRLAARLGTGAPPELVTCGDPHSGWFDALLTAEGGDAETAHTMFEQGLEQLPALDEEQRQRLTETPLLPETTPLELPPRPDKREAGSPGLFDRILGWLGW